MPSGDGAVGLSAGSRVPLPQSTGPAPASPPTERATPPLAGLLFRVPGGYVFRACGAKQGQGHLIDDRTDGDVAKAYTDLAGDAESALFVELRGTLADPPAALGNVALGAPENDKRRPFVLTEVVRAAPAIETRGCKLAAEPIVAWASGNEPFWTLSVTPQGVTFIDLGVQVRSEFAYRPARRTANGFTLRAGTLADGNVMTATFVAERCIDSMSGAWTGYSVTARVDGRTFDGCGRTGRLFELVADDE